MATIKLFHDQLIFDIPDEDWEFLCQFRFSSGTPNQEELQAEFVSSTGITEKKKLLWESAGELFQESIEGYRAISQGDMNKAARELLSDEEREPPNRGGEKDTLEDVKKGPDIEKT